MCYKLQCAYNGYQQLRNTTHLSFIVFGTDNPMLFSLMCFTLTRWGWPWFGQWHSFLQWNIQQYLLGGVLVNSHHASFGSLLKNREQYLIYQLLPNVTVINDTVKSGSYSVNKLSLFLFTFLSFFFLYFFASWNN